MNVDTNKKRKDNSCKCTEINCNKKAIFKFKEQKVIYCSEHKREGMISTKNRMCMEIGCQNVPRYNISTQTTGIYCAKHKKPNMINVKSEICIEPNCGKQPSFNTEGLNKALYCASHKKEKMVMILRSGKCIETSCKKRATFNVLGEIKMIYCLDHKKEGMISVSKRCTEKDCIKIATFNVLGKTKGIYCSDHKKQNMINVTNRKCMELGCQLRPTFNILGKTKGIYCSEHKKINMTNVVSKKCVEPECKNLPSYNFPGQSKKLYCASHKKTDMVNIVNKICIEVGCNKLANFNTVEEKGGIYCLKHKKSDMINVKSRTCIENNCRTRPYYGIPGTSPQYCSKHKKTNTIINPKIKCVIEKCGEIAIYGTNKKQQRCEQHKDENDINLIEKECKSCKLPNILGSNNNCYFCDPVNIAKFRLAKQNQVKTYLDQHDYKYISCDKAINNSECIKERPDFLFDCKTHYIVLEVDENQHKDRICECEFTRMINISQALGMQTIFIRYNPDTYIVNNKKQESNHSKRMPELDMFLKYYINIKMNELKEQGFLSVLYLFFDDYNKTTIKPQTLLEFEKV
ncbi:MAG: hypothetical protein Terrestrivirus2_6 [Terrestrivirus sp.]|uniref:Endonuclease n=1 Tax=Terrestrivirus sp. TaxID=2487775 RepID=A0A3G4ZKY4_9VIRU|nr:MAG: hypothetical protein Terrestrivirus2_6 [Terrestrivirus sp.]